jgi:preprotein translocase subunit SecD
MINKFPLWKYILLFVLTMLSIIYALPNLYGDEPALQISPVSREKAMVPNVIIKNTLAEAHIDFKSIQQLNQNLWQITFPDTESQLKARDFVKAALGDAYTVALNLVPATPRWLNRLGATPMKLGLDLRGGVHFLLAVDVDSVVKSRIATLVTTLWETLQKKQIRYAGASAQGDNSIVFYFRDKINQEKAKSIGGIARRIWK